jgi:hypothetical protein
MRGLPLPSAEWVVWSVYQSSTLPKLRRKTMSEVRDQLEALKGDVERVKAITCTKASEVNILLDVAHRFLVSIALILLGMVVAANVTDSSLTALMLSLLSVGIIIFIFIKCLESISFKLKTSRIEDDDQSQRTGDNT